MGVIKHLRTLFPLPKKWEKDPDERAFGLRLEEAYRWIQTESEIGTRTNGRYIHLLGTDNTWAKVWKKLKTIKNRETVLVAIEGTPYGILSGGIRQNGIIGTISRYGDSTFRIIGGRMIAELMLIASITDASASSAGTYSERVITDELNNRLVGKQSNVSVAANANVNISIPTGGRYFFIFSCPGIARTWVGIVYSSGSDAISVEQINNQTTMTVTTGTGKITVKPNYSSATRLYVTCIPMTNIDPISV